MCVRRRSLETIVKASLHQMDSLSMWEGGELDRYQFRHEADVVARLAEALEAVAHAKYGLDVGIAVGEELLAQPPDVHIQRAGADVLPVAPDALQQNVAGYDLAGVLH